MKTRSTSWLTLSALLVAAPLVGQTTAAAEDETKTTTAEVSATVEREGAAIKDIDVDADVATTPSTEPAPAAVPAAEPAAPAAEPIAEPASDMNDDATADELPQTASPLALLALLGVGSGGAAFGLRAARRRH